MTTTRERGRPARPHFTYLHHLDQPAAPWHSFVRLSTWEPVPPARLAINRERRRSRIIV